MISFENDYSEGAHPRILERFIETNMEQAPGYGNDPYCESAAAKIKDVCGKPDADVEFIAGGTQTNMLIIASLLQKHQGVISAVSGHIALHEAGAIENTGHKVLALPEHKGKIDADELSDYIKNFYADGNHEHMVFPGMVYITHSTEYGTIYKKDELKAISDICRSYEIPLFLDGARLGYGLMSHESDITIKDIAQLCDVFYIGGTKVGALCGEAVVFSNIKKPRYFTTMKKQHGALLAKGRLLGIQFDTLFTDDLYFEISRHAIEMADALKDILKEKGCRLFMESPTNQQFIIMKNSDLDNISKKLRYSFWETYSETETVIRLCTSWATKPESLELLKEIL